MNRFEHQIASAKMMANTPRCFNHSDPGTGKTITTLDAFTASANRGRMLVLAPLSILTPSWGADIEKATEYGYAIAHGSPQKREAAFRSNAKIVITNHDAVNWLVKNMKLLAGFTHCAVDEYTVYKNRTSQRGKAVRLIAEAIPNLWMLSGTPDSNGLQDIWYPAFLLDKGERLGKNFWHYRTQVSAPKQVGPRAEHIQWADKPGAELEVAAKLKDITVRYKLEDCIDMPEHSVHTLELDMPNYIKTAFTALQADSFLEIGESSLSAIHAGAKAKKILQLLSGAVYNNEGEALKVHEERYKFIMDLVEERQQCLIAFNWKHELAALVAEAESRGLTYGVINGDASVNERTRVVEEFQAHRLRVIFAHPQSAAHGLTLTAGTATIWASPTHNAEHYTQFNRRIYRAGQTKHTETIRVAYKDSPETGVYDKLDSKVHNMESLLNLMMHFSTAGKENDTPRTHQQFG